MIETPADAADAPPSDPPEGFVRTPSRGPFTTRNGPLFHKRSVSGAEQAFFAEKRHCNGFGLIHGGMLAAFLDGLLAAAAAGTSGLSPVTLQLSVSYLAMGRAGGWVTGTAEVTRVAREIAFAEGVARMAGRDLARASGVFRLMRPRP